MLILSKFLANSGEQGLVIIARDLNEHAIGNAEDSQDQHKGYGFGVKNKDWEKMLEGIQLNMNLVSFLWKKINH